MHEFYLNNTTPDELRRVLGPGWAIARKTPRNLARYERCITRKEYEAACKLALVQRKTIDAIPSGIPICVSRMHLVRGGTAR